MFKKKPSTPPAYSPNDLSPQTSRSRRFGKKEPVESAQPKKEAYRPSAELQKQIDVLCDESPLSTVTSGTQTEYFDVLPSFQMFQSILRRDQSQFSENDHGRPPVYGDENTLPSPPNALSPVDSPGIAQIVESAASAAAEDYDHEASTHNQNVAVTETTHSPLDHIDRLGRAANSPIDVQIYVTKQVPQPGAQNELETRLKEYTSDDVVNGYIVITNTSSEPVEFGLFTVSLEGTAKMTVRNNQGAGPKFRKIVMKKFLKMYDLNASYGYTHVPNSVGVDYDPFSRDVDGCILGLPDERVLQPHEKYKKFFTFRFPKKLLDNACVHGILPHLFPPASYGFDRTCFSNRGEGVQLQRALGYGFLNTRGTPLLTKDYAPDNTSISYTIEAKFIDKVGHNVAVSEHEINADTDSEFAISASAQFFLRFIPNLNEKLSFYKEMYDSDIQVGVEYFLFHGLTGRNTMKRIRDLNDKIEREVSDLFEGELSLQQLKLKNMVIGKRAEPPSRDPPNYHHESRMVSNRRPVPIYGKKKKSILSSLVKVGTSTVWVRVPGHIMSYASPKLLMKYNHQDNGLRPVVSNSLRKAASNNMLAEAEPECSLRPVSLNNITELYDADSIDELEMELHFSGDHKPPQISSIDVNIVSWSFNSDYSIPFEINHDFFYSAYEESNEDEDEVAITRKNLQYLKDQAFNYISFFDANNAQISRTSFLYLKAMKHLAVKKDTIKEYFKSVSLASHPQLLGSDGWSAQQTDKCIKWTKKIRLPLEVWNKNNINLLPSFQSCLVGRLYCLQVLVRYRGGSAESGDFGDNVVGVEVPVMVG